MSSVFPEMDDLGLMSGCLLLVALVYIVSGFFANIGMELFYYVVCGFALVASTVAERRFGVLSRYRTEMARVAVEQEISGGGGSRQQQPGSPSGPAPVIGRPPAMDPEEQYGGAPWARGRRRPR